ncbi:MAG TPA: hypothetical protein VKX39_05715 [Bryobacteraceae bacterium]|nr:hypothetical protein [Bryobacteraceae bacterium]
MRRRLAWIAFVAALAFAIRGFAVEHLFRENLWSPEGLARLIVFSAAYWISAGVILWLRPAWFFWAAAIFALGYSEWWCALVFTACAPLAAIYFLGSCFLLGRVLFPRLDTLLATLAGFSIWIFLLSIAAHFPVNRPAIYFLAFAAPYLARSAWPKISFPRATAGHALLIFVLMMHWLIALKPETGSDALAMHLAIPEMIARAGRFSFDFREYTWALMPMGGDFAFAGAYLLGGEAAARLLNFAMLALIAAIVYRASLRWLSPGRAALAAALFASTPLIQLVTGSLYVENIWAALIAGAAVALWTGELAVGGMLLGAAFSTKLGTSAYVPGAIALAWIALRKMLRPVRSAAAGAALLVLFASPPYFYAWVRTRNPIFPFANSFFRSPYFDTSFPMVDARYRPEHSWSAFYALAFRSANFIEGQNGAMGFQYFLLLAPLLILLNRKGPRAPVWFGAAGAAITFLSLPNLRYLYPAMPLVSIGIAWLWCELPAMTMACAAMIALNIWFMPASGWQHDGFALFTRQQFEHYLLTNAPQRKLVEALNRIAPGQPAALLNGDSIAGLRARAFTDTWHTFDFWRQYLAAENAAAMSRVFHQAGVRYVIAPAKLDSKIARQFLDEWTAPTGYIASNYELRRVVDARIMKPIEERALPAGSYDDLDPRIEYAGSWLHDRQFAEAAGSSITYSKHAGDRAQFAFNGSSIEYVYTKAANRGIAEVWIDRKLRAQVDLYSEKTRWRQSTAIGGLEAGPHTLEVRVSGRKNAKSADYFVDLDQFVVKN